MKIFFKIMGIIEAALCCACITIMLALAFANVVGRFCGGSISFTEEIVCGLFVLLCVLGTSLAIKKQSHLGLSLVSDRLPKKAQRALHVFGNLLGAGISAFLAVLGWQMVQGQIRLQTITATLQWPAWIYGIFLPIGAVFMTIRFLQAAYCIAFDKEVL